jgi:acetyltransferase-like isoleucine patch superfamily enzyme
VKKAYLKVQEHYTRRFLRPQFTALGRAPQFIKPWFVEVFGAPVQMGHFATVIAASDARVRLSVWPAMAGTGGIRIGDYCMLCPGVRLGSAREIVIEDNCMIASRVYITDCDWHGLYDRLSIGRAEPVRIGPNAWIGDSAVVCKGVTVGRNSVVGAGSVVVEDVPDDSVAAGNPARVVKRLDQTEQLVARERWFADPQNLFDRIDRLDRTLLANNTVGSWIRHLLAPKPGD